MPSIRTRRTFFCLYSCSIVEIVAAGTRFAVSVKGFPQKCLRNNLHMSTPDVRFLLTMFPKQMCGYRTKRKGAGRQMEARCIGDHLNVNTLLPS